MEDGYLPRVDPSTARRVSWKALVNGSISKVPATDGGAIAQYLRGLRWDVAPCEALRSRDPGA